MTNSPFVLSKDVINEMEIEQFQGCPQLIASEDEVESSLEPFLKKEYVGFDTETKPSFKKGTSNQLALVQIATSDYAVLYRVSHMGFPKPLKEFLELETVIKVAQEPGHEIKQLKIDWNIEAKGFYNLGHVAKELECTPRSIKAMCAHFLGFRISKSCQTSNWERDELSQKQISYAATDAWACYLVFEELIKRGVITSPNYMDVNVPFEKEIKENINK